MCCIFCGKKIGGENCNGLPLTLLCGCKEEKVWIEKKADNIYRYIILPKIEKHKTIRDFDGTGQQFHSEICTDNSLLHPQSEIYDEISKILVKRAFSDPALEVKLVANIDTFDVYEYRFKEKN